jgi:hypothetical protein
MSRKELRTPGLRQRICRSERQTVADVENRLPAGHASQGVTEVLECGDRRSNVLISDLRKQAGISRQAIGVEGRLFPAHRRGSQAACESRILGDRCLLDIAQENLHLGVDSLHGPTLFREHLQGADKFVTVVGKRLRDLDSFSHGHDHHSVIWVQLLLDVLLEFDEHRISIARLHVQIVDKDDEIESSGFVFQEQITVVGIRRLVLSGDLTALDDKEIRDVYGLAILQNLKIIATKAGHRCPVLFCDDDIDIHYSNINGVEEEALLSPSLPTGQS